MTEWEPTACSRSSSRRERGEARSGWNSRTSGVLWSKMRGPAETGRGVVSMADGRQGQGAGKGNGVRGYRLPSPLFDFFRICYEFWLSVSTREVASEFPFFTLIYMNSYTFHIQFIHFIYFLVKHIFNIQFLPI